MVPFSCATSSKMVTFPGVTPKDILLYLDVHLTIYSADTVILHAGVDTLLEDNSQSKIENLGKNLKTVAEKCYTYGITNVSISSLVYTTRICLPVLE